MPVESPATLEHRSLTQPALSDPLWRYMDFTKFTAMLVNRGLYMSRLDRLGDAHEGWIPDTPRSKYCGIIQDELFTRDQQLRKNAAKLRKAVYVNCWHANDEESYAMWKLYIRGDNGVAIRTTCSRLRAALERTDKNLSLYCVMYADQAKRPTHSGSMLRACMTKRPAFAYEKEVRLVWQRDTADGQRASRKRQVDGFYVQCDIDQLLDKVNVAPTCNPWFTPIVKDILQRYRVKTEVFQSALDLPPPDHD